MKMRSRFSIMTISLAGCLALNAMASEPAITNVVVRQHWPWSRLVNIDYVLSCDTATQKVDVIVNAYDGDTVLNLPSGTLTGNLHDVTRGQKRIDFDPTKTAYTNVLLTRFSVDLKTSPAPLYMIVDLTKTAGEVGQTEYVYEAELVTNKWGSWVRNPVSNDTTVVESVIWTGVTNGTTYKADKLVLRRVPAGSFTMGDGLVGTANITLTKDFYVGVFEVTQWQWKKFMVNSSTFQNDFGPVEMMCYYDVRENADTDSAISPNWPNSNSVGTNSFVGKLRAKSGMAGFDLPTEAQWEYACRAGTTTYYNDGLSGNASTQLDVLGWYTGNSGSTTHTVGLKQPNAWGLYDTLGNLYEWCLDWPLTTLIDDTDPKGASSNPSGRERRGGSWASTADACRSAFRGANLPNNVGKYVGFRLVRNLE